MKSILFFFLCFIAFYSCTSVTKDEIRESIPGTYIRSAEHEYGSEQDTVIISVLNAASNEYKITRRWKYERIMDGKAIEPEYKLTDNTGVYSSETKMLQESSTLETYSFDPKQKLMFSGEIKYQKLK
jgi:hypothetical protein